jgi:TRAP-type C4-dicarboxylate transport system permease small subunit
MLVGLYKGVTRKTLELTASFLALAALALLFWGGIELVLQTMDTNSVATGVNMGFINCILPIMAAVALIIRGKDFLRLLRKPAGEFTRIQ